MKQFGTSQKRHNQGAYCNHQRVNADWNAIKLVCKQELPDNGSEDLDYTTG